MRFPIILIDCPWPYNKRNNKSTKFGGGTTHAYARQLSWKGIEALPIAAVATPDALLFHWTTMPHLTRQLAVPTAWEFAAVTNAFTWTKTYLNGEPWHGVGHYSKSNAELCYMFRRGRTLKPVRDDVSSDVRTVHPRYLGLPHSRKPAEVRERIALMYPDLPKLELFATEAAPGWTSLGCELSGRDIREDLEELIAR